MGYVVEITKTVSVQQGMTPNKKAERFELTMKAGIAFADKQLNKKGYYINSNELEKLLQVQAAYLSSDVWTSLFDFPPTLEHVSKWLCQQLAADIKQLEYVELENKTTGIVTQYIP